MSATATPTTKRLTAAQARKLHDAEAAATRAKRAFEEAKAARDELRARYHDRVPLSADTEERAKGIRVDVVAGVKIRIAPQERGDSFSLAGYKAAGHRITPEMAEYISPGKGIDRWTVNAAAGPKKIGAVEPA